MNTRLLRRVQKAIVANAAHFDMNKGGEMLKLEDVTHSSEPEHAQTCGTAACIAGFTVLIKDGKAADSWVDIANRATELLGLDCSANLFWISEWPYQYRVLYRRAETATERAKAASKRIDRFIKTKGEE